MRRSMHITLDCDPSPGTVNLSTLRRGNKITHHSDLFVVTSSTPHAVGTGANVTTAPRHRQVHGGCQRDKCSALRATNNQTTLATRRSQQFDNRRIPGVSRTDRRASSTQDDNLRRRRSSLHVETAEVHFHIRAVDRSAPNLENGIFVWYG